MYAYKVFTLVKVSSQYELLPCWSFVYFELCEREKFDPQWYRLPAIEIPIGRRVEPGMFSACTTYEDARGYSRRVNELDIAHEAYWIVGSGGHHIFGYVWMHGEQVTVGETEHGMSVVQAPEMQVVGIYNIKLCDEERQALHQMGLNIIEPPMAEDEVWKLLADKPLSYFVT